jgi:hypothetical protein
VDVTRYGATGDGATDDTAAIQAAVSAAQASDEPATVRLPPGTFLVSAPIVLGHGRPIRIVGSSMNGTVVKASAGIEAIFEFTDHGGNNRYGFEHLQLHGNGLARFGVLATRLAHGLFFRVRARSFKTAGISVGHGWNNDFVECELAFNDGDGLRLTNEQANAVNVVSTKLFRNRGFGLWATGGHALNVTGCTIEENAKGGIYVQRLGQPVNVERSYFESNGAIGQVFTSPSRTVKAHILLNGRGGTAAGELAANHPSAAVGIEGNFFSQNATNAETAIWVNAVEGLTVRRNLGYEKHRIPLIKVWADARYSKAWDVVLAGNQRWSADVVPEGFVATRPNRFRTWDIDGVEPRNYWPADLRALTTTGGGGGTIAVSSLTYQGHPVWVVTGGTGSTDEFGVTLDLDGAHAHLAGRFVYIAATARTSSTGCDASVGIHGLGHATATTAADTRWKVIEQAYLLPSSGSATFTLRRYSGKPGDAAYFTKVVVAQVGARYDRLAAVPRAAPAPDDGRSAGQSRIAP